jgi:spore maturation protein CgeB
MRRGLNIAFFGSSLVSAYWNGAATYYRGIVRALHDDGHRITFYEPDAYERQAHRDFPDPPWARVVVYSSAHEEAVYKALKAARGADLIVKASGVGVFDELLERAVLELRRPGSRVVFWDVDAPATLDRVSLHPDDPFRALIPRYDLILTYGGGDELAEQLRTLAPERALAWPANVQRIEHLSPAEHRAFYTAQRFTLNVTRADMVRAGYSPSIRLFEAAACATAIVSDYWPGLETFLTPGKEILIARSPEETLYCLCELPESERLALGGRARARVLAEHTAAHRAAELEAYIRELQP